MQSIVPAIPSNGAYRNISLLYYKTNPTTLQKTVICALDPRRSWIKENGQDYAVAARTVLVTVTNGTTLLIAGVIVGCDWAPSSCVGDPSAYVLDAICAYPCTNYNCNYNITVTFANDSYFWLGLALIHLVTR